MKTDELHLVEKYLSLRERLLVLRARRKAAERAERDSLVSEMEDLWWAMSDEELRKLESLVPACRSRTKASPVEEKKDPDSQG
jgi:hypothetical protein